MRTAARAVTSLDRPLGDDGKETLGSVIPAGDEAEPFEEVRASLLREGLRSAADAPPRLEREVIAVRYLEQPPLSLAAAARVPASRASTTGSPSGQNGFPKRPPWSVPTAA